MANQTADMKHEGMTTMPSVTELVTSSEPVNFEKDVTTTVNQKIDMKHEPVEQDELVSKSHFEQKISHVLDDYFRNISNLAFLE